MTNGPGSRKAGLINSKHMVNDSFGKAPGSSSWSCTTTAPKRCGHTIRESFSDDLYTANQAREPQLLDVAEQIADALIQTRYVDVEPHQSQIGGNTTKSMPFVTARISAEGPAQPGPKRRLQIQDWVYFQGTDNKLWRVRNDGSHQTQIGRNTTSSTPFVSSRGDDDWVYFQGTDNKLWRVKHNGGEQSQIGHNTTKSMPFVMQHGNDDWVYFQGTDNKLWRAKHDGSQQSQIGGNTTSSSPHVMSVGGEDWVHFRGVDNKLWRVKYDGGQQTQIGNNTTSSSPFVTAGGWVYFQGTDNRLWKVYLALGPSISGVNAQGILTEFNNSDPQGPLTASSSRACSCAISPTCTSFVRTRDTASSF